LTVNYILIFIPITISVILTLIFSTIGNVPIVNAISTMSDIASVAFDRASCEEAFSECSNVDCSFFNFDILTGGSFRLCGDTFYILNMIGSVIALFGIGIAMPFLLMIPPISIELFGQTIDMLKDFWFVYSPIWAMFGIGILGVFW